MHPWTADLLEHRAPSRTHQHQRALAMRMRRVTDGVADYLDLLDIPRHHAALRQYDDLAVVAKQVTQVLSGTLAVAAYLAEIRPLIPPTERAWFLVGKLEMQTFLAAGDIPSATRLAHSIYHHCEARAAADPANPTWQQDVAVIQIDLGDLALAVGDLPTAKQHYQAALAIDKRLVATDSANTFSQRDLSISHNKLGDLAVAGGDLTGAQHRFQAGLDIAERLAAMDRANAQWQRDLAYFQQRMASLVNSSGEGPQHSEPPAETPDASSVTSSSRIGSRITGIVASLFRSTRRRP